MSKITSLHLNPKACYYKDKKLTFYQSTNFVTTLKDLIKHNHKLWKEI